MKRARQSICFESKNFQDIMNGSAFKSELLEPSNLVLGNGKHHTTAFDNAVTSLFVFVQGNVT